MPVDQEPEDPAREETSDTGEPRGIMISLAVLLLVILVALVIFMNFAGQEATAATAITENGWSLQSFTASDGTVTPVLNGTVITASFGTDGTLTGSGGCNRYSGRYLIRETQIVISPVATTAMACWDPGATLQEDRYYASLGNAAELRVHDRVLTLYGTDGKPLLTYIPARAGT